MAVAVAGPVVPSLWGATGHREKEVLSSTHTLKGSPVSRRSLPSSCLGSKSSANPRIECRDLIGRRTEERSLLRTPTRGVTSSSSCGDASTPGSMFQTEVSLVRFQSRRTRLKTEAGQSLACVTKRQDPQVTDRSVPKHCACCAAARDTSQGSSDVSSGEGTGRDDASAGPPEMEVEGEKDGQRKEGVRSEGGAEISSTGAKGESDQPASVKAALSLLRFYKREISPWLPGSCRFVPTCSEYAMIAFQRYGFWRGGVLTAWRLLRCNPLGPSGFDPPRWFGEPKPPSY